MTKPSASGRSDVAPERNRGTSDFLIPGLSLVLITSYAPFTIAALLAIRFPSISLGLFVAVIFFSMAVGTILSAKFARTGLIVAPAVGMASFVNQTSPQTITTAEFLLATLIAGFLAILLSRPRYKRKLPSMRQAFLDGIPRPVKVGVRGGVGALLAAAAIHGLQDVYEHYKNLHQTTVIIFVTSVLLLLAAEIAQRRLEDSYLRPRQAGNTINAALLLAARSANFIVPLGILILLYNLGAFPLPAWHSTVDYPGIALLDLHPRTSIIQQTTLIACFAGIVLFVFITDIPGSPYEILQRLEQHSTTIEGRIDKSFIVTSIMSTLNPLFGLFTSVYYAENHIVVLDEESQRAVNNVKTAWFCGLIFFCFAVLFAFLQFPVKEMKTWLLIAVAPSLFCLGIRLTARALQRDVKEEQRPGLVRQGADHTMASFFVPVSLTILLTHFIGFELALPLGIIYYGSLVFFSKEKLLSETDVHFRLLFIASCLVAFILSLVRIGIS